MTPRDAQRATEWLLWGLQVVWFIGLAMWLVGENPFALLIAVFAEGRLEPWAMPARAWLAKALLGVPR